MNEVSNIVWAVGTQKYSHLAFISVRHGLSSCVSETCFPMRQLRNSSALATSDAQGQHDAVGDWFLINGFGSVRQLFL